MIDRDWMVRFAPDQRGRAIQLIARLMDQPQIDDARQLLELAFAGSSWELAVDIARLALAPMDAVAGHIALAQIHTAVGNAADVVDACQQAIHLDPESGEAWFYLCTCLWDQGRKSEAQMAMLRALQAGYDHKGPWRADIFTLMLNASGEDQPRIAEIMKPCPLFGTFQSQLDPRIENVIATCLDFHQQAFARGDFVMPPMIPPIPPDASGVGKKILLVQNEFINAAQANIRNDIADTYEFSARANGFEVRRSLASERILFDPNLSRTRDHLDQGLSILDREIDKIRPDIVLMDGNFMGHPGTIEPAFFSNRAQRGLKLVVTIPDLYDRKANVFDYWAGEADLLVYLNRRTSHVESSPFADKALYWPGLPFEAEMFAPLVDGEKAIDLCMIGSLNRGREYYAKLMEGLGFPGFYLIHDRSSGQALSVEDYRRRMAQSKMIFNNGVISTNQRIVTARVFEIIYSGAVLLEESGSDLDGLYLPWVHYLPFANIHQFAALCQYMQRHDDQRQAMTQRALAWTKTHFPGRYFWNSLLHRLGI